MRLQVFDSDGSIGGGNKLADTLSKAFFGDGEAAAKIALAKAQIAAQQAHAGYYGAQTGKTQQETSTAAAQHAANVAAANAAAAEAEIAVPDPRKAPAIVAAPAPVTVGSLLPKQDTPTSGVDSSLQITAPLPAMPAAPVPVAAPVTPEQIRLYEARRAAEAARVRSIYTAGGNAQQIAEAANKERGGQRVLYSQNPDDVRRGATLTTGNLPSTTTVTTTGDVAGVNAAAQADAAKPLHHWATVNGVPTFVQRNPDGAVTATPAPGITPTSPDPTTPRETITRIESVNRKMDEGQPVTKDEVATYARDIERIYKTQKYEETDPQTKLKREWYGYGPLPGGTRHPDKVAEWAGIPPAPAPSPAPVPAVPGTPAGAAVQSPAPPLVPGALTPPTITGVPADKPNTEFRDRSITNVEKYKGAVPYFTNTGPNKITPRNVPQDVLAVLLALPGDGLPLKVLSDQATTPQAREYISQAVAAIWPGARYDSGAAVQKSEILNEFMMKIPLPGNTQREIDMKLTNLAGHVKGIALTAFGGPDSPGYKKLEADLLARGFDINQENPYSAGNWTDGTLTTPGAPATGAPTDASKPVRKLDLTTGKFN